MVEPIGVWTVELWILLDFNGGWLPF